MGLDVYLITPITLGKRTLGVGGRLKRNDVGENTTTGRVVGQILLVIGLVEGFHLKTEPVDSLLNPCPSHVVAPQVLMRPRCRVHLRRHNLVERRRQ